MWWLRQVRWPECLSLCLCIQRHMSDLVFNVLLLPWALCSWSCFFLSSPTLCLPLSRYLYFLLFQQTVLSIFPMGDSNIWIRLSMSEWHFACLITEAHPAFWGTFRSEGCRCACRALEKFLEFMLQTSDDLHTSFTNWMSQSVHFYIALL